MSRSRSPLPRSQVPSGTRIVTWRASASFACSSGSTSEAGVDVSGGTIDLTGITTGQPVARDGTITSIAGFSSLTVAQNLVGTTVTQTISLWQSTTPDNVYTPLNCADGEISERIITIVAIDEWLHPAPMPIRYFVPMYIVGCENPDTGIMYLKCERDAEGAQGHIRLHGIIFQAYLVAAGDVGAPNDSETRVITLVE